MNIFKQTFFLAFIFWSCATTFAQVSGMVFRDFNTNGTKDNTASFNEPFVGGITVNAYNSTGVLIATQTTTSSGTTSNYSFPASGANSIASGTAVRLEFVGLAAGDYPSKLGSTNVQFVTAPATNANFGINNPEDYVGDTNPYVAVPQFINGTYNNAGSAAFTGLYTFQYQDHGNPTGGLNLYYQDTVPNTKANVGTMGATWGVAYQRSTKTLYTSAVLRRFCGFGPLSTGGIYKVDMTNPTTNTGASNYIDVRTIGIPTGNDVRTASGCNAISTDPMAPANDIAAGDNVGKLGIGGIEYDEDRNILWLVNLNDRKLYGIKNISPTTTPTSADVVGGIPINLPAGYSVTNGVLRPWGVKVHRGYIYVGAVADASTSLDIADLEGYILKYDLNNPSAGFTVEFTFGLDYPHPEYGPNSGLFTWDAWEDNAGWGWYSQPIISDIEFDTDGSLIIGVMDRGGMQNGNENYGERSCTTTLNSISAQGDILRACKIGGSYVLSGNGGCTTTIPPTIQIDADGDPAAPNTWIQEYYWGDHGPANDNSAFNETALGALAFLSGTNQIITTSMDPENFHSGGVLTLNNTTGGKDNAYSLYFSDNAWGTTGATMAKAIGLGDVEILANTPIIEIGNRVWHDTNNNGIQDAGEAGVAGVTLQLSKFVGGSYTNIATCTTDANGNYYFSSAAGTSATGVTYNLTELTPNSQFKLSIPTTYNNLMLTAANIVSGSNADAIDSDADGFGTIVFTTGNAGENNHSYDIGFQTPTEICTGEEYTLSVPAGTTGQWYKDGAPIAGATGITYVVTSPGNYNFVGTDVSGCTFTSCSNAAFIAGTCARLGNYVWNDLNSDGINNEAASAGINGVNIQLYKVNGGGSYTLVDSTVTANKNGNPGYYQFIVHTFGDYLVRFIPPTGKNLTKENQTANTDNNSDADGVGVSGIVNLVANENDSTIDAGFVTPCVMGDILYLASNVKGADPDAFDRGMIQYLQSLGNTVTAALTEQTTGFGLKDFYTNAVLPLTNFNGFNAIIVSPTVEWNSTALLQDSLRATRLPVMVSDFWNMDSVGLVSASQFVYETEGTVYNGTSNIDLYYYYPFNPTQNYGPGVFRGDYYAGADVKLWRSQTGYNNNKAGVFFSYEPTDVLYNPTTSAPINSHGRRVAYGIHSNGLYENPTNMGALPSPASAWLNPFKHFTAYGKRYLDSALLLMCTPKAPSGSVGNYVWTDTDGDGTQDAGETGINGVTVELYQDDGSGNYFLVGTTTTTTNGGNAGYYNFSGLGAWNYYVHFPTTNGASSLTTQTTTTATDGNSDANTSTGNSPTFAIDIYGIGAAKDNMTIDAGYKTPFPPVTGPTPSSCPPNTLSMLATPLYSNGNPLAGGTSATKDAFVWFNQNNIGEGVATKDTLPASQLGTTWGVAYKSQNNTFYTSAFLKRHAGFGSGGPGAIYKVDLNATTPSATVFADLSTMGVNVGTSTRVATSGAVNDPNELPADATVPNWDVDAYAQVGKMSLGGLDISDDGTKMYVMSLKDKELVELNISGVSPTFTAKYTVPDPACSNGDYYPWAVKYLNGKVYVGVVCTGETSQQTADLQATIYEFNAGTFTMVYSFPLNYPRGNVGGANGFLANPAEWRAWTPTFRTVNEEAPINRNDGIAIYPQPILSDIEFDTDGSIVVALMDRNGHQTGTANYKPVMNNTTLYTGQTAGDVVRIGIVGGQYQLENNASASGSVATSTNCFGNPTNGQGNGQGPANGEYYWAESYAYNPCNSNSTNTHDELAFGGLAFQAGSGEIAIAAMNPTQSANSGGIVWLSNTTGDRTHIPSGQFFNPIVSGYRIYESTDIQTFGKAAGMGDIEYACIPQAGSVGNYVWTDTDGDGNQDAGETGINGVTVELYKETSAGSGSYALAQTTTTANNGSNDGAYNFIITESANYYVHFPTTSGSLSLSPQTTTAATDGNSDANLSTGNSPIFAMDLNGTGVAKDNPTIDAGYSCNVSAPVTVNTSLCDKGILTLSATGCSGGTMRWYDAPTGGNLLATGTSYTTPMITTTTTYYVDCTVGVCTSARSALTVTVYGGYVGNYVWTDANSNGLNDEPASAGINGVLVELWSTGGNNVIGGGDDALVSSVYTADDNLTNPGYYEIPVCVTGNYYIHFPTTNGTNVLTTQTTTAATDNNSDANISTGNSPVFAIDVNGTGFARNNPTIDAGYMPLGSVGNYVWNDANNNGLQDDGTSNGINGVLVQLWSTGADNVIGGVGANADVLVNTTTTANNGGNPGYYNFVVSTSGNYYVKFPTSTSGKVLVQDNPTAATDGNSDANAGGFSPVFNINIFGTGVAKDNPTIDAGYKTFTQPSLICGMYVDSLSDLIDYSVYNSTANLGFTATGSEVVLGGERDVLLHTISGTNPIINGIYVGGGATDIQNGVGEFSKLTIQWDGIDNNPNVLTPTGLGGLNFAAAGLGRMTFELQGDFGLITDSLPITLQLWSNAGAASAVTKNVYFPYDGNYHPVSIDFSTLVPTVGTGVNLANIGAVQLEINMTQRTGWDVNFRNLSLGCIPTSKIGDYVWLDDDKDGVQDGNEKGISGVLITLYQSISGGMKPIATTQTDAYGKYLFINVPSGDYQVGFSLLPDYTFSPQGQGGNGEYDSDANASTGRTSIFTVVGGTDYLDKDAGLIFQAPQKQNLGNFVWLDSDIDGRQDANECGVSNVKVTLWDNAGNLLRTTTTDGKGEYYFTDLATGNYVVSFELPQGFRFTTPNVGTDDLDSDVNWADQKTGTYNLSVGENEYSVDAGIVQIPLDRASVGNFVWNDMNMNGLQDATEVGLPNVKIDLYDDTGILVKSYRTDGGGYYIFNDLVAGYYVLKLDATTLPAGFVTTQFHQGANNLLDSDAGVGGFTDTLQLNEGDRNLSVDFGAYQPSAAGTAQLGDRVWYDLNKDGVQNPTEYGVPGVEITLYNATNTAIARTVTNAQGLYRFVNLGAGTYTVSFKNLPEGYGFTTDNLGGDDNLDSDANVGDGLAESVTLTNGQINLSIDAGIYPKGESNGFGSIGDRVWNDGNNNGLQDANEQGVPNITVDLLDNNNNVLQTTYTNGRGQYLFTGLLAGRYQVRFSSIPAAYQFSTPYVGINKEVDSDANTVTGKSAIIILGNGENNLSIDAGLYNPSATASVGNYVWYDKNQDGMQGGTEPGVQGVNVCLYNDRATFVATTISDENGFYQFSGLNSGNYYIVFSNLPDGFNFTQPAQGADNTIDSDADAATGGTALFSLSNGQQKTDIDAGVITNRAMLGNYVWEDTNKNGQQDSDEQGLSGVTVRLYNSANQLVSNAITDWRGKYLFINLQPGAYYVQFTTVPNYTGMTGKDQSGIDDELDSDADLSTLRTGNYTLAAGDVNLSVDGGVQTGSTASLEGYTWFDSNADGLQSSGESPVSGIVVQLINGSGQVVAVAITDETGRYYFDNVAVGTYSLNFTNTPTGSTFTQSNANGNSQDLIDSDVNGAGRTITSVTVIDATNLDGPDAGLVPPCSVRGTTFCDEGQNPDGLQSPTEPIIQGVTVTLYLSDGTMVASKTTDKNGNYAFTGLTPDDYYVGFEPITSRTFTGKDVNNNANDDTDSDADQTTGLVDAFRLSAGEDKTDVDAGYVGSGIVFPIELLSFEAEWSNDDALLKWVTKTELNSDHFEIWRSIDDVAYEKVMGDVAAAGTSNATLKYHTYDEGARLLNVEKLYYKLKMVDIDGSFKWSNTAELTSVNWADQIYVSLYPNPARTELYVDYQLFTAKVADLKIVNNVGQMMYAKEGLNKTANLEQEVIDVSKFASGIYYLQISTEENQIVKKFVVE